MPIQRLERRAEREEDLIKLVGLALAAGLALALATPLAHSEDRLSAPAIGDSDSLDEHHATSEDLEDLQGEADQLQDRETQSHDPDEYEAASEDIQDHEADSEQLEDHEGDSTALQRLPDADEQVRAVEQETMRELRQRHRAEQLAEEAPERPAKTSAAATNNRMNAQLEAVHAAKQELEEARASAERADRVYADMLEADYPRGEARLKIVNERKVAHEQLGVAERSYDAALRGGGGPASN